MADSHPMEAPSLEAKAEALRAALQGLVDFTETHLPEDEGAKLALQHRLSIARQALDKGAHICPWCPVEVRDLSATAHNVVVNRGNSREGKKLVALQEAVNRSRRDIDRHFAERDGKDYVPCLDGCEIRPGGLFHERGCPNDWRTE